MMKKIGMLIGALLVLCMLGAGVMAAEQPAERFHETIPFQVNPLYEGLIDPADFVMEEPAQEQDFSHTQPTFNSAKVTYVSEAEAIEQLRGYMVNRTEEFELHFTSKNTNYEPLINEMMMEALSHTGNPTEGDYLTWHFAGWGGGVDWYYDAGIRHYTYVIQVAYYTTADQEKELDTAVNQLLNSLNLSGKSDYEKVCAVYDYIRDNITYDYENLNNPDTWLQYTAYSALINKTAVCQGYANLLYRLLLELGIDNRVITGETLEGPHAWNIVKLGDVYYNCDSTWDAIIGDHDYFLKNSIGFLDHARHMDYATTQFHTEYPMSETDYVDGVEGVPEHVIAWGICGEEVYWAIDRDGVLTIGGTGPMLDLPANEPALWDYWDDAFDTVIVEEGVTSIGQYAFYFLHNIKRVELPGSVQLVGAYAFRDCLYLEQVILSEGLERIGESAFSGTLNLQEIQFPSTLRTIENSAFQSSSLISAAFHEGLETIGDRAFSMNPLESIVIPSTVTYLSGFEMCGSLSQVELNNSGVIGTSAFSYCSSLETIIIPEGITEIQEYAFYESGGLKEITIPSTVTRIGELAFVNCTGLEKAILYNGGEICRGAFSGCSSLKDVQFLGKLERVGDHAFAYGPQMEMVVLPESIKELGNGVFYYSKVSQVFFTGDAPAFQSEAFQSMVITAYYPANNPTWTDEVRQQYDGTITWLPYDGVIPEEPEGIPGDINGDGKLNNKDASRLFQYLSGWNVEVDEARLDINGDGKVNNKDASRLFQYLSGWDVEIF